MSETQIFSDPSIDGPQFLFNDGQVANNAAVMDSFVPNVPGPLSSWKVTEWSHFTYLDPAQMQTNSSSTFDPLYGNALYSWNSSDHSTTFDVYSSTGSRPYVYDLQESGTETNPGGADLFLSTSLSADKIVTFDHPISFSMMAKLSQASATFYNGIPAANNVVLSQLLAGFVLWFNVPGTPSYNSSMPTYSAFMQIEFGSSRQVEPNMPLDTYAHSDPTSDGAILTYSARFPADPYLPFEASTSSPTRLTYNLNNYLDNMIQSFKLPESTQNLGLWSLKGMYVGIETENGTPAAPDQGSILTSLQVSNLSVTTDTSQTTSFSAQPPASGAQQTTQQLPSVSYTDTTLGISGVAGSSPYKGTYTPLSYEYVSGTNDNMVFITPGEGMFVVGGSGNDAIKVISGNNVIDGGGGSNFLGSGTGTDMFLVDLGPKGVWDTLVNFHPGDSIGIWGFVKGLSKADWAPTAMGAENYSGATLIIESGSTQSEVTFAGLSLSQAHLLAMSYGSGGAGSYLELHNVQS